MTNNVIKCGKGWESLYMPVIEKIMDYDSNQEKVEDKIGIKTIEEVDGSLKIIPINDKNMTNEIQTMILDAYYKSHNICSFCGTESEVGTTMNDKYQTCCKTCWQDNILKKNPNSIWKCYETNKFYKNK